MNVFWQGCIKAARETPRGFFAPAVALWRLLSITWWYMVAVTEDEMAKAHQRSDHI
jgi:hypothetical protein